MKSICVIHTGIFSLVFIKIKINLNFTSLQNQRGDIKVLFKIGPNEMDLKRYFKIGQTVLLCGTVFKLNENNLLEGNNTVQFFREYSIHNGSLHSYRSVIGISMCINIMDPNLSSIIPNSDHHRSSIHYSL